MPSPFPSGAEMLLKGGRVKDGVEYILKKHPQAIGDYRILDYYFCRYFTGVKIKFDDFKKLRSCPSFETINRRYREVCVEMGYKPSKRVQIKRQSLREAYKNYYGNGLTLADFETKEV